MFYITTLLFVLKENLQVTTHLIVMRNENENVLLNNLMYLRWE